MDGAVTALFVLLAYGVGVLAPAAISYYFTLAGPAAAIEGTGPVASLRRSVGLMRGFFWKGIGILLLCGLIVVVIQWIFDTPSTLLTFADNSRMTAGTASPVDVVGMHQTPVLPMWRYVLEAGEGFLSFSITLPISALGVVLFYYDLRVRKEGFDLQMLAHQLE